MSEFAIPGINVLHARLLAVLGSVQPHSMSLTLDPFSIDKLGWLKRDRRNFMTVSAIVAQDMTDAFALGLDRLASGRSKDQLLPWKLAGAAYQDDVAERLATGGGDMKGRMKKLSVPYIKRKGFSKIGVLTGALLRDVVAARVVVR